MHSTSGDAGEKKESDSHTTNGNSSKSSLYLAVGIVMMVVVAIFQEPIYRLTQMFFDS